MSFQSRTLTILLAGSAALAAVPLAGCRGAKSHDPPLYLQGDMDWQPKASPQEASNVFADGRAMRPLVEGTIARGTLAPAGADGKPGDSAFATGMRNGKHVARAPVTVDQALLDRGHERFNIYCAPCHDQTGSGKGMVVQRGFPPPVDLASDRVREMPDGQLFETITNGVRNMPAYKVQIPKQDRWAIVAWVRVLERSQHGSIDDVPPAQRSGIAPADPVEGAAAPSGAPAPSAAPTAGGGR